MPELTTPDEELKDLVRSRVADRFIPVHFVVNDGGDIVYSYAPNIDILQRSGAASGQFGLPLTINDLSVSIRQVLSEARQNNRTVVQRGLPLSDAQSDPRVDAIVEPLPNNSAEPLFLVMLDLSKPADTLLPADDEGEATPGQMPEQQVRQLDEMREQLHRHVVVYERLIEKLRPSYEKLRLVRQELAASKQMLQLLNRQLSITNAELGSNINHIDSLGTEDGAVLQPIAILLLDRSLLVRSFNSTTNALLFQTFSKTGKTLDDYLQPLPDADALIRDINDVMASGIAHHRQIHDPDSGVRYSVQILPHRDATGRLDGSLVIFLDIGQA